MKPHNLLISFIGACLLWIGWFGFNAGSALTASGLARSAFVALHCGAAAAAFCWVLAEVVALRQAGRVGRHFGCVTGPVAIAPESGFGQPFPAWAMGFSAGVVWLLMVAKVDARIRDSLDAVVVHGIGGTLDALPTGILATRGLNNGIRDRSGKALPLAVVDVHASQVVNQAIGCAISCRLAIVGTRIISIGFRGSECEQEVEGRDVALDGEGGRRLHLRVVDIRVT